MSTAFVVLSFSLLLLARSDPDIHRHSPFNKKIHTQNKNKNKKSTAPHSATVADTKERFLQAYSSPIPAMYSPVVQELLVQQHLQRYNANYVYNPLYALGIMSVFDQILESLENKDAIVDAYFTALQEDLSDYRRDADAMEEWAKGLSSSDDIKADASGTMGQKVMAEISEKVAADKFLYTNFLAVGVFRVLELSNLAKSRLCPRVAKVCTGRTATRAAAGCRLATKAGVDVEELLLSRGGRLATGASSHLRMLRWCMYQLPSVVYWRRGHHWFTAHSTPAESRLLPILPYHQGNPQLHLDMTTETAQTT